MLFRNVVRILRITLFFSFFITRFCNNVSLVVFITIYINRQDNYKPLYNIEKKIFVVSLSNAAVLFAEQKCIVNMFVLRK